MSNDTSISSTVWDKYHPTSLALAKGASWLFFSPDMITFILRDAQMQQLEMKVYRREDKRLRDLFG